MNLAVVSCMHGNERYGLEVALRLPPFIQSFIANEKALVKNKRFIDVDLNRCFPGGEKGNHEEKLAYQLNKCLKDFDYVLDLHSSSKSCPLFGIITKPNEEKIEFAKKLGLKKLVIMPESFASGKALIDFVKCGLSLEIGPHERKENVKEVLDVINNTIYNEDLEIFEVIEAIPKKHKEVLIENFIFVKKGEVISKDCFGEQLAEFDFIPVLAGEEAYQDVLCLGCRQVNLKAENLFRSMAGKRGNVTPYDVSGEINYDKLIEEFGVRKIDDEMLGEIKKYTQDLHFMLKRGVFFASRDLKWLLDKYSKKEKFFLYTGCGPSGPIHLGHLQTWIFAKWLQDKFDVELWFQFTDDEKFLFKDKSYEEIQKWTYENMLDVIAVGFNPKKTHFLVDTKHAGLLYPEAIKFAKKINFSTIKSAFGFKDSNNIGSIFYTAMQAVPAIIPSVLAKKNIPCLIPLAIDQDPHFRVARDVYPKLGYYKPSLIEGVFLPPLGGVKGKMSSTGEQIAIYTTDKPNEVKKKINKYAFSGGQGTLEEHREKGGNPDVDVSFQYLRMLFEESDEKLKKIEEDYRSGKLLTGELKQYTINKINKFLEKHQKAREKAKSQIDKFLY